MKKTMNRHQKTLENQVIEQSNALSEKQDHVLKKLAMLEQQFETHMKRPADSVLLTKMDQMMATIERLN